MDYKRFWKDLEENDAWLHRRVSEMVRNFCYKNLVQKIWNLIRLPLSSLQKFLYHYHLTENYHRTEFHWYLGTTVVTVFGHAF